MAEKGSGPTGAVGFSARGCLLGRWLLFQGSGGCVVWHCQAREGGPAGRSISTGNEGPARLGQGPRALRVPMGVGGRQGQRSAAQRLASGDDVGRRKGQFLFFPDFQICPFPQMGVQGREKAKDTRRTKLYEGGSPPVWALGSRALVPEVS